MGGQMLLKLALLVIGLLAMVPETSQLNVDHPLFGDVQKLNLENGPFLGLVVSSKRYEETLKNSTYLTIDSPYAYKIISGRKFHFGRFNGVPTIWVLAGSPLANVGVTVQIFIDTFVLSGIICFGAAATVTNQVFISNVVVPSQVIYTGSWIWEKHGAEQVEPGFKFGDFNSPQAGDNTLASIKFQQVPIYTSISTNQESTYFIDVNSEWYSLASGINYPQRPTVVFGAKAGTSDVYVSNEATASILGSFGVSIVDTESAAVVTTAIANGIKSIVFRGASNRPGTSSDERLSQVTADNVLDTVAKFVDVAYPKSSTK